MYSLSKARKETSPTDEEETDTIAFPELKLIKTNTIARFFSSHLITSTCARNVMFLTVKLLAVEHLTYRVKGREFEPCSGQLFSHNLY